MKKKFLIGICTLALMLGFTACGNDKQEDIGGYSISSFEEKLKGTVNDIESMDETMVDYYISQAKEMKNATWTEFFENVKECLPLKGKFEKFYDNDYTIGGINIGKFNIGGTKALSVEKSGKTVTASIVADYSKRDLKVTYVFNINDMEQPTAINVEPVYSLGETMSKAGLNTVMGIAIVFCMLVVMSGVIKLFEIIPALEKRSKAKKELKEKEDVVATPVAATVSNPTDDLQLVAVIAAAIAASTGASTDSFVVRSIKKR